MEISNIPIADFYKQCIDGARDRGFKWIITLVARPADVPGLYENLMDSWHSLDSLTANYFLFLFAGKENRTQNEQFRSRVANRYASYQGVFNRFLRVINPQAELTYSPYDWRSNTAYIKHIDESQTDAIDSLKRLFDISEASIPCLVFTSLNQNSRYVVKLNRYSYDLYDLFKSIFEKIDSHLCVLREMERKVTHLWKKKYSLEDELRNQPKTIEGTLYSLYSELCEYARQQEDADLQLCIENRRYKTLPQPIRGKLSKYIDLSKEYEQKNKIEFRIESISDKVSAQEKQRTALQAELNLVTKELPETQQRISDLIAEIDSIISDRISLRCINGEEHGLFVDLWIPDSGDEFEKLAQKVCTCRYKKMFSRYGRNGQAQYGIDLYTPGFQICVQCKNYQGNNAVRDLCNAISKDCRTAVGHFYEKGMRTFVIATTVRRDRMVQDVIEDIRTDVPEDLDIQILFMEDIREILRENPRLLES